MTKPNSSHIAVILDRSGSMSRLQQETITGFNVFLDEQKKLPGEAFLTLAQFDDQYQLDHDGKPIADVAPLTDRTYVPRGWTALYDALGRTITAVGAKLAHMPESERPSRVLVLVVTDGIENHSTEFTGDRVAKMIKIQREQFNWEFLFMGASEEALQQARAMNFAASNTRGYKATSGGTKDLFGSVSRSVRNYRSGGSV